MKRVWLVKVSRNGFLYCVFVRATEERLLDFINTELPHAVGYTGATDSELECGIKLGLPVYCY